MYGHQGDVYYGQQYYGQGGAASNENYEQDDYDNLDEIEKEMNKATLNTKTEDEEESALKELIQSDRKDEIQQKPAAPRQAMIIFSYISSSGQLPHQQNEFITERPQ